MTEERTSAEKPALKHAYNEYGKLSTVCVDLINHSFSDIKLLGAVGALLTWDPLSRLLELDSKLNQPVTPIGFLVLLLVIMLILFYDLMKQSIFFFHLERMREFEHLLNKEADNAKPLYHLAGGWPSWFHRCHRSVAKCFYGVFYLLIIAFPCAILYLQNYPLWILAYLMLAISLMIMHAKCAQKVLCSLDPPADRRNTSTPKTNNQNLSQQL
jgi:hypothetical protein